MINVDEVGMLDKRIRILTYKDVTDAYGLTRQELVDAIGNMVWARVEPARGRTYYEQYRDKVELLTKITIRYRPNIDERLLVEYRGQVYRIMSVVDPYEAHVKLELMCNKKESGEGHDDG